MGQPEVRVERLISADPLDVYWLVADVGRMGEWSPETEACEWTGGATGPAVGAKFRGTNRNGKKNWSTACKVVAADPGTAFAFEVTAGPVKVARWTYTFEPTAEGCRVAETWTDHRNWLSTVLSKSVSGVADRGQHNRATMEQTLDRLATVAERPTS